MLYSDEIYIEDFKRTYTEAYRKGFIDGFNERGYLLTYIGNDHIETEQTEQNSSEKPNNCEVSEIPTGSIISKMEQVEDEPKTESIVGNSDTENAKYTSDCPWR